MSKKNVLVLFGGVSSEHEVSLSSAYNVLTNLDSQKYNVYPVGITKQGAWLYFSGDYEEIKNGSYLTSDLAVPCMLSPDRVNKGLYLLQHPVKVVDIDVILPVLHGKNGEDGTIQGLFELCHIPYVGCPVIASANCMDKVVTKILLENAGIATTPFVNFDAEQMDQFDYYRQQIAQQLGYPVFVKPANAGSSVGVSRVECEEQLLPAVEKALKEDRRILVEKAIVGKEVECAVLGNTKTIAGVPGWIESGTTFYDYDAKYLSNTSTAHIPAPIGQQRLEQIQQIARCAFAALGCRGLARVDFFVGDDFILLNEINTLPGFTNISMYPQMMMAAGYTYPSLLDALIELALKP